MYVYIYRYSLVRLFWRHDTSTISGDSFSRPCVALLHETKVLIAKLVAKMHRRHRRAG